MEDMVFGLEVFGLEEMEKEEKEEMDHRARELSKS